MHAAREPSDWLTVAPVLLGSGLGRPSAGDETIHLHQNTKNLLYQCLATNPNQPEATDWLVAYVRSQGIGWLPSNQPIQSLAI